MVSGRDRHSVHLGILVIDSLCRLLIKLLMTTVTYLRTLTHPEMKHLTWMFFYIVLFKNIDKHSPFYYARMQVICIQG
jgi:hypothetical protein